jgi:uncharacterized membrane protein YgdD (TMEM256/DUF423 family)
MNKILASGAALGLISVIMGALGDHAFTIAPEKLHSLETAIRYNMLYAVLITALCLAPKDYKLYAPAILFTIGTTIFCFSIYAALLSGISQLTYLTPFGGLTLMAAWASLIYKGVTYKSNREAL